MLCVAHPHRGHSVCIEWPLRRSDTVVPVSKHSKWSHVVDVLFGEGGPLVAWGKKVDTSGCAAHSLGCPAEQGCVITFRVLSPPVLVREVQVYSRGSRTEQIF